VAPRIVPVTALRWSPSGIPNLLYIPTSLLHPSEARNVPSPELRISAQTLAVNNHITPFIPRLQYTTILHHIPL